MKQILQSLNTGITEIVETPCPQVKPGHLLIRSCASLVSAGTERMLVEFGKANLAEKAFKQPERVKQVLEKVKTDGVMAAVEAVRAKLDQPVALGYSNAGVVMEVGAGAAGFEVGDRVVSNGPHAEVVCVPKNLCAKIPAGVSDEAAAFTALGAVGLQGLRLALPTLGENFVVIGLGLVGLLTVQLLKIQGCRVMGVDFDRRRLALADSFGVMTVDLSTGADPVKAGVDFSAGRGVDGVIITAATQSNDPVHQAARMCRRRGRIILVGVAGLELSRSDFYQKELMFQVSCSYGPGRYDPEYEVKGNDYPIEYVRWTARRNFETILGLLADGSLQVEPLISHRFPIKDALQAYQLLQQKPGPLGMIVQYPQAAEVSDAELRIQTVLLRTKAPEARKKTPAPKRASAQIPSRPKLGLIGAGEFAARMLLPALQRTGAGLKIIASGGGLSGVYRGRKFGFAAATTDPAVIFGDPEIEAVLIAARHDQHAALVCQALAAGKHVFVEKPLAVDRDGLMAIRAAYEAISREGKAPPLLMVGFNRRFAPQTQKMKALLAACPGPQTLIMTVNAGAAPVGHWTMDPETGGGRIIGEACHFIDLLRYLTGSPVREIQTARLDQAGQDTVSITLRFENGSIGAVHYLANGAKSFPKERLEVFCGGKILQLNNFIELTGYGWPGFKRWRLWRQDKGHRAEIESFIEAVRTGAPSPIPFAELVEVTEVSFKIAKI
ncbi:MAG: bi-domain-containing oxidoreductase [Firmicutes bacterium]|nr:bi-domain-containing oxidoreductase [Bacillota bacterium]